MKGKILLVLLAIGIVALALVVAESRNTSRAEIQSLLLPREATSAEDAPAIVADGIVPPPFESEAELEARRSEAELRERELAERERRLAEREAAMVRAEARRERAPAPVPAPEPEPLAQEPVNEAPLLAEAAPLPEPLRVEPRITYREDPALIPAGTVLRLEFQDALSSESTETGAPFRARVTDSLFVDGRLVVPSGSTVTGVVTEAKALKKIGGRARLALEFQRLELPDGRAYTIAQNFEAKGRSETKRDAATIGGAAAAGAILGRAVKDRDRSKGGTIGAILGAAAGAVIASQTEGEPIEIAAGERYDLVLDRELEIPVRVQVIEG